MMLAKGWFWIQGHVLVQVQGTGTERLLNRCLAHNIYLWQVYWQENTLYFRLAGRSFRQLRSLVRQLDVRVRIVQKTGLPFLLRTLKRRKMLAAGSAVFLLLLYLWSNCVWSVQIRGALDAEQELQLGELLTMHNVAPGALQSGIDLGSIEHEVLNRFGQLAWVRAHLAGTRFILEVIPKLASTQPPIPSHLIASESGVLLDLFVLSGTAHAEPGTAVAAGDILVLGEQGRRPVVAKGKALARVWREGYKEGEPVRMDTYRSGRSFTVRIYRVLGYDIPTGEKSKAPFVLFEYSDIHKNILSWRNRPGAVEVIKRTYYELQQKVSSVPVAEFARELSDRLTRELTADLSTGARLVQCEEKILSVPGDKLVRVWVRIEAVEDIAQAIPYYPLYRKGGPPVGGAHREENSGGQL